MIRTFCLTTALLVLFCSVASAQVTLEPKYPEGSKSVIQTESKSTQTLTLAGMDIDTTSSTFLITIKTIGKRAADGTLKVEEKVDSMQSEISLPGGLKLEFDSGSPEKEAPIPQLAPLVDVFRAICRLPVTVVLDSKNKITDVKLPEGEYEKLAEGVKDRFSPETLTKASKQAHEFLPDEPVKKGDTWERASESNLGSGQVMSFRTRYEYVGTTEKDGKTFDKITGKTFEVSYTVEGNPMLKVTKSDLKVIESAGTFLFDRDQGLVVSRSSKVQIAGPLTLVINNMELPGKVDLTIEEKISRQK